MDVVRSTDSFFNFLLHFPHLTANNVLSLFLLTLFRILPIIVFAPFLGGRNLPNPVKIMFGIALASIFIPTVLASSKGAVEFNWLYLGYSLKELAIGFILGFLIAIPFFIGQASGSLIDHARGSASLQVTDPTTQTQTGPLGLLYNYALIAIFFAIGGPFYFFNAVADSFQLVPVDAFFNPHFFSMNVPFWHLVVKLLYHVMSLAVQLAAPSLIGILMVEMFLGIANRLAPQVQIVFLGIPLKSWTGLALLSLAWVFILKQLGKESLEWVKVINNIIHSTHFYKS